MSSLIESHDMGNGITLELHYDDSGDTHPYNDQENLGTFYHWHRRGFFGEDITYTNHSAFIADMESKNNLVFPIYLYEHSGQTINMSGFSCGWDSGAVGVWVVSAREFCEWNCIKPSPKRGYVWTAKRKAKAREQIEATVKYIDMWLIGQVYGWKLSSDDEELYESCWGYIEDFDSFKESVMSDAKAIVESYIQRKQRKEQELLESVYAS